MKLPRLALVLALPGTFSVIGPDEWKEFDLVVNGATVGVGIINENGIPGAWVRFADLSRWIDGDGTSAPHLRLKDGGVVAVTAGGCGLCRIHVQKTGQVASSVRVMMDPRVDRAQKLSNPEPFIALTALTKALGASGPYDIIWVGGRAAIKMSTQTCASCTLLARSGK